MSNSPLVSVIIPTYNRADKLRSSIESVLAQTYENVQLIVVDDGSVDHTSLVMKNYPQAEYVIQKHAGQATARNTGLSLSKGSIVASLDSDDVWNPLFLERCVTKLEEDHLDFVFANWIQEAKTGDWDFLSSDPFLMPHFRNVEDGWVTLSYGDLRRIYMEACPSPSSSVVIRKSSIMSGWDDRINVCDDWCMYLDVILSKPRKVAFTLEKLWRKTLDTKNIYDGRKRHEVLKFLYIEDTLIVMDKFSALLSTDEMGLLKRRYVASLVELAKHELIRERNLKESFRLLKTSLDVDIMFTLKMIPDIAMRGLRGKLQRQDQKLNTE